MKQEFDKLYNATWALLKKWFNKFITGKDDDDNPFGTPYAIL